MVDAVFPSRFSTGYFEFFRRSEQRTKIEIEKFTSKLDFNFIWRKIKFLDSNYMIERFLWILITGLLVEPLSFSSCHSFGVRVNFSLELSPKHQNERVHVILDCRKPNFKSSSTPLESVKSQFLDFSMTEGFWEKNPFQKSKFCQWLGSFWINFTPFSACLLLPVTLQYVTLLKCV